jgi:predicted DNA-binding protein with PD1-like motif
MKFRKEKNFFVVKLEPGDEAIASLKKFADEQNVKAAFVQGVGAAKRAKLGSFSVATKKYKERVFKGDFEVLSLSGNLSETGPHLHAVISSHDFGAAGGHVFELVVSVTLELFVFPCGANASIQRELDERFNLKLMKL